MIEYVLLGDNDDFPEKRNNRILLNIHSTTTTHQTVWFLFAWITLHGTCQQNKHTKTLLCFFSECEKFPMFHGQKRDGKPMSAVL